MKRKRKTIMLLAIAVFCGLILWPTPAEAALVTIAIEAVVDDIVEADDYLDGRIKVGDLIKGTYSYDTDTPDSSPLTNAGRYEHFDSPCGFSLTVGGFEFESDPANTNFLIEIVDNYPYDDGYGAVSYNNLPLRDGTSVGYISWALRDSSATAISSADLTPTVPVLDAWDFNFLQFGAGSGGRDRGEPATGFGVAAHVTSAVLIPEPMTILLLGSGAFIVVRRRTK